MSPLSVYLAYQDKFNNRSILQYRTGYASLHLTSQTVLYDSLAVSVRYDYTVLSHSHLIKMTWSFDVSPRPGRPIVWVVHSNWPAGISFIDQCIDPTVIDRNTMYEAIHWYDTRWLAVACPAIYSTATCHIYLIVILWHWVTLFAHYRSPHQSHTGGRSLWWWCHQPAWLSQRHLTLSVFTCHIESSVSYMQLLIFINSRIIL